MLCTEKSETQKGNALESRTPQQPWSLPPFVLPHLEMGREALSLLWGRFGRPHGGAHDGASARSAPAAHNLAEDAGAAAEAATRSCAARTAPPQRPISRRGPEHLGHAPLAPRSLVPIAPRTLVAPFAPLAPASHSRLVIGAAAQSLVCALWWPVPGLWQWHAAHTQPPRVLRST